MYRIEIEKNNDDFPRPHFCLTKEITNYQSMDNDDPFSLYMYYRLYNDEFVSEICQCHIFYRYLLLQS